MTAQRLSIFLLTSVFLVTVTLGCGDTGDKTTSPPTSPPGSSNSTNSETPHRPPTPDLSGLPAQELAARAKTALSAARTFRASAVITKQGEAVAFDINYGAAGSAGNIITDGHKIEFILTRSAAYMKAPDTFYRQLFGKNAEQALVVLSGKWLKGRRTDPAFQEFGELGNRDNFVHGLLDEWPTRPRKFGERTISGIACLGIADRDGVLWINKADGRPVQIEPAKTSETKGRMVLSAYGAVPEPVAPSAATTIDITKLKR